MKKHALEILWGDFTQHTRALSLLSLYLIPINIKTSRVVCMRRQAKRQTGPYSAICEILAARMRNL